MTPQLQISQSISHYKVEELLGSGGMGVVYRGTDVRLGRRVALKFLRPFSELSMQQRLMREARAASSLDHPNICTIFEVDETAAGEVFIAMAYYEGQTLDQLLKQGPFEVERALALAIQTGRGLAAAHEELIVHRDIKPANLMVTRNDTVKILDFGLALLLRDPLAAIDGVVMGTPSYMSPEQLRNGSIDQRTDIWSLGVVLYEMLNGVNPFRADTIEETINTILHKQPPPGPNRRAGISSRIDTILQKALSKDARDRFQQIDIMVRELIDVQAAFDSGAVTLRLPSMPTKCSIAVLPFEDMSPSKDQEYLCDGIAEEILRALSRVPDLHVASRTSAFQYKHRASDIREIGARLHVDNILEGSVRRSGDRVRISAQLVNVDDGYRLWDERFDRDLSDIFAIEDEIAERIAEALKVTLVDRSEARATDESATEAYDLYLQGRQFFHQHRRKAFETALQIFSQVIEVAPTYARAYAGIADCHSFLHLYFGRGWEAIEAADRGSAKALELDPSLSDAHASRGLALFIQQQFDAAEQHLHRAIELDPRLYDPHYISGRVCFSQGRTAEAAAHFREACSIVPEAYDSWYLLGMCYRKMSENTKARRADLECIEAVKKCVRHHPDDTRAWTMGGAVLAALGEPERAEEWVKRALAIDADEPIIEYNAACVYVRLQKHDEAIACLEASVGHGGISKDWVKNDPDLNPLRGDPRFERLLGNA